MPYGKLNVSGSEKVTVDGIKVKEKINLTTYNGENPFIMGQSGMTLSPNTLIKNELQIINGVGGEDLTVTTAEQTVAVEDLIKMVGRKIADHKGEGPYVWKKYSVENKVYQTTENAFLMGAAANSRTITIAYASDYSFNEETKTFTLINPKEYTETLSSVNENVIDGSYVIQSIDSWQNTLTEGSVMLYIPEGASVTVADCKFTTSGSGKALLVGNAAVYKYGEVTEFLNYVVSSGAEDYPNEDELDSCRYELLEEGVNLSALFNCSKVAVDTFTPSARTTFNNFGAIPHSLGQVPRAYMIVADDSTGMLTDNDVKFIFAERHKNFAESKPMCSWFMWRVTGYTDYGYKGGSSADVSSSYITSTSITPIYSTNGNTYRLGATKYTLITMV